MSKKNILIVGYGNVGKAIAKIEKEAGNNIFLLETNHTPDKADYDICHITIPYSKDYVKIVSDYLREFIPRLTIIHTTIIFDILRDIKQITGMRIVYAPVNSPSYSDERKVYKDKKEKPTKIIGYDTDIKYSKQHLDDILSKKIVYKRNKEGYYTYQVFDLKPPEKIAMDYPMRNAINDIQKKLKNPLKKIGKYF